jgi:DNA-binding NarL/FixJ family response regulator
MSLDVEATGLTVLAEPSEVQQIIMNLASNAEHAMRGDGGRLALHVDRQTYLPGDRLADKMLKIRRDIPIILCTGYSHTASPEKAGALGVKGFLMKPIAKKELAGTIRKVLDRP